MVTEEVSFSGDLRSAELRDWITVQLSVRLGRIDRLLLIKRIRQAIVSCVARRPSAARFATPYGFDLMLPTEDQGTLIMAMGKAHLHPRVREILESNVRPGDVVVDGGSNVGFFSLVAAMRLNGSGRVISFEPNPRTFGLLRQNVAHNHLESIVRVEEKALTSSNGTFEFTASTDEPMRSSLVVDAGPTKKTIRVSGVRLDDYVKAHNLDSVDIIKLDLEGAEPLAIEGMAKSLLSARLLVFEVNGPLLSRLGVEPLRFVRRVIEVGSFKEISFVDEQENRTHAWNSEQFELILRNREIVDIVCTKEGACQGSTAVLIEGPSSKVRFA